MSFQPSWPPRCNLLSLVQPHRRYTLLALMFTSSVRAWLLSLFPRQSSLCVWSPELWVFSVLDFLISAHVLESCPAATQNCFPIVFELLLSTSLNCTHFFFSESGFSFIDLKVLEQDHNLGVLFCYCSPYDTTMSVKVFDSGWKVAQNDLHISLLLQPPEC